MRRSTFVPFFVAAMTGLSCAISVAAEIVFAPPEFFFPGHAVVCVETSDLDRDGNTDIVVSGLDGQISVLRNTGTGAFEQIGPFPTGAFAIDIELALLDHDGFPDLIAVTFVNDVIVMLGRGDGSLGPPAHYNTPGVFASRALDAGDLDGDGDVDLLVGDAFTSAKAVLLNDGQAGFDQTIELHDGAQCIEIALGDLDHDGDLDAVSVFLEAFVHLNDGDGRFAPALPIDAAGATSVALADLDRSGSLDIAASISTVSQAELAILLNQGDGRTFLRGGYPIDTLARDLVIGDLDGDHELDVATSHVSGVDRVDVLRNRGDTTFELAGRFFPGFYPQSIAAGDFDHDGRLDLVTANEFDDPPSVGLLRNLTTRLERVGVRGLR
jgi:hypothetical protein